MTDEFRHRTSIEVRFRDVDAFGHVNNAVFLSYVEQARILYLREVLDTTVTLRSVEELPMILGRLEIDFRAPIFFGETVEVETHVDWIGRSSFAMSHRLTAGADAHRAADVTTVLVAYDYERNEPMAVPDAWRARMTEREGHALDRAARGVT